MPVCNEPALVDTKGSILWDSPLLIELAYSTEISGGSGGRHKPRPRLLDGPALSFSHVQLRQGMEVIELLSF